MEVSDWLIGISALATLALAIAAFRSIKENRRIRDKDRDLDFKRRTLDGILNWAQEVHRQIFMPRVDIGAATFVELQHGLRSAAIGSHWVVKAAGIFGQEFQAMVDKAAKDTMFFIVALREINKLPKTEWDALVQSLENVVEAAFNLKSEHKL